MISPSSPRKIGLFTCIFLVAAVMIGNGIYTSLGIQLLSLSNGFSILALWALGGVVALCGALSYAELASLLPHSGGEYYYLTKIYHPAVGTMAGIITLLAGFVAPIALASMAFGKYLQAFLPSASPMLSSMLLVTLVTMAHLFHLGFSASFQNVITGLKFLLIAGILFLGFRYATISPTILLPSKAAMKELFQPSSGVALLFCFYAYSGWNASVYIADDVTSSQRTVGVSLVVGTLLVILIYLLLNVIFLMAAPMSALRGVLDVGAVVGTSLVGPAGGHLMAALIAVGLIAGISGMIWIGPRVAQMMGRDLFALRWLGHASRSNNIPIRATLLQYVLIIIVLATSSFKAVLVSTQVPIIFCSLLGVVGTIVLRCRRYKNKMTSPDQGGISGFRCPLYPLPPLFFVTVSSVALVYTMMTNPWEGGAGIVIIAGALGAYPLLKQRK